MSRDVFLEKSIGSLCRESRASTVASRRMLRSRVTASSTEGDAGLSMHSTTRHNLQPTTYIRTPEPLLRFFDWGAVGDEAP